MLRIQTICLVILTIIAVGFALHYLQSVLLPFVIAFFIVSGCRPILDYLENRFHLHWVLSFAVTFGIGAILLVSFSFLTWASVNDLANDYGKYEKRIRYITTWIGDRFPDSPPAEPDSDPSSPENLDAGESSQPTTESKPQEPDEAALAETTPSDDSDVNSEQDQNSEPDAGSVQNLGSEQNLGAEQNLDNQLARQDTIVPTQPPGNSSDNSELLGEPSRVMQQMFDSLGNYVQSFLLDFAGTLTSLLSSAILVLIYVFFLLLGRAEKTDERVPIVKAVDDQIRKYIVMKTVISAITALATFFVLAVNEVPLAVVFALLTFLINFIPNIGPVIISLLPLPFLILNPEINVFEGFMVFFLVAAIQFISGNVVETRVMGKSFDVNPVVLLLALMFFGLIWGIPECFWQRRLFPF